MARSDETYLWGATHAAALMSSQGFIDFADTGHPDGSTGAASRLRVHSNGLVEHLGYGYSFSIGTPSISTERFTPKIPPDGTLDPLKYYVFCNGVIGSYSFRVGSESDSIPNFRTPA
ncbi:MAG TPA: hypothetical protein VMV44_02065 [Rectinemataceae bacterium]|nr:hypothetical protein [Rectinemataceae bacterium]